MADMNIYLTASYAAKPKDPKKTSLKGYMLDPDNIRWDEMVHVCRGLRKKDQRSQVILDLTNLVVVKNSIKPDVEFAPLFEHFHKGYANYILQSITELNKQIGL